MNATARIATYVVLITAFTLLSMTTAGTFFRVVARFDSEAELKRVMEELSRLHDGENLPSGPPEIRHSTQIVAGERVVATVPGTWLWVVGHLWGAIVGFFAARALVRLLRLR